MVFDRLIGPRFRERRSSVHPCFIQMKYWSICLSVLVILPQISVPPADDFVLFNENAFPILFKTIFRSLRMRRRVRFPPSLRHKNVVYTCVLIVLEVPLFYEVSNLSPHQTESDFSRDVITGKPDVYYQIYSNNNNNKVVIDY